MPKSKFINADTLLEAMSPERRARIDEHAQDLADYELTLQELRRALALTQDQLSVLLGVSQDRISRIESGSDMLVSTLAKQVEAMGASLRLVAVFPDQRGAVPISIPAATPREPHRWVAKDASGQITEKSDSARVRKRELIEPHKGDKRYIRRDERGRIRESDDVGRSLAQDRGRKTSSKPVHRGKKD